MVNNRDIINIEEITKEEASEVLQLAAEFEKNGIPGEMLTGKVLGSLFFEPSTRTRLSFEAAALRLGAKVIGFSDTENTSVKKGESLEDTIRMVDGYVDAVVMRHPEALAAQRAADVAQHPVINAGDGANQHPTQTLLDLYAIQKSQGKIDGITIAMVGDLKYGRVPHSLAKVLTVFDGVQQFWVAPENLAMPKEIFEYVEARGGSVEQTTDVAGIIPQVDILYMTRVQEERFAQKAEYEAVKDIYILQPEMLQDVRSNMKILHALPRRYEIPTSIDDSPHAYYFEQARGGMYVRAALLALVLGEK